HLEAFESNGFNNFIDFADLKFDQKSTTGMIGSGGYGEVFSGTWEGAVVAIKKFGGSRNYNSKKQIKDFIKEIELVN
ncbi:MAG: hypothetical protein ACK53Y_18035, partial [bacterium]